MFIYTYIVLLWIYELVYMNFLEMTRKLMYKIFWFGNMDCLRVYEYLISQVKFITMLFYRKSIKDSPRMC